MIFRRIGGLVTKLLEFIGIVALFIINPIRLFWMWLKASFRSPRGRIRWALLGVVLLTLWTATYNESKYYNQLASWVNSRIASIEQWQAPKYLGWVKQAAKVQLPEYQPASYRLGLDLVGGTQLLYDADTSKVPEADRQSALDGVRDVIERRVNAFGVAEPVVQTDRSGDQWRVLVELAGVQDVEEAIRQIGETPLLEFKEQDTAPKPVELTPEQKKEIEDTNAKALATAKDIIARLQRGEDFAALANQYSEDPSNSQQGGDLGFVTKGAFVAEFDKAIFEDLKVNEVTKEPVKTQFGYHVIQKLEERGEGDAKEVHSRHILLRTKSEADYAPADQGWKNTELSGKQLANATVVFDPQTNQPQVSLVFNEEGSKLFEQITERNIGSVVGIFLDGVPISVPRVQQAIPGGQAVITGDFTIQDAKLLVQRLNAGALPVPITLVSQQTIGATLGESAIQQSLRAALFGFLLVAAFMILYYRLPGVVAVLALLVYASLVLAIFKFWPVTLTLAGITGFILSMGMAVDANVLIFERIKEELRIGRALSSAVEVGFQRAWTSIRDSNASSLITCAILAWFGTSVVQGFALTLAIGIVVSMFSAITVTRTFLKVVVRDNERLAWWFGAKRSVAK